jgi:hypothetical protein
MNLGFGKLALSGLACVSCLSAASFNTGDVMASLVGNVHQYTNGGASIQTLTTGLSSYTTGSAFDSAGNFYVTDFGANTVVKFNTAAVGQGNFGGGYSTPEDILIDGGGKYFVGSIGGGIREFNSAGTLIGTLSTPRTDWFDMNSSESITYFTDESGTIHRWNNVTNTAMTDLGGGGQFALRLLGDGTLLVASSSVVNRINATTGAIVHSYTIAGSGGELFALNLDPDGTSFWTGDVATGNLYKVNIATGAVLTTINTGGGNNLFGVSVKGEITQVSGVPEPASVILFGTVLVLTGGLLKRKFQS